ncbi:DUF4097 family beta strand repeat-containing protein [Salinimicrobium oceani]|uniref:DUF4097 family beta strand repeat protein n=1 Tax=Salinimicrobium oceani TaxID=2722702 RepID=A0ABX1CWG6_9FLAO|nr:DUF4097 family beta strand repeat-containing protein [Salinimicrobium oceani]NJW52617.1 DUF4097 family beta strand repeat protein [Salinimicrobium oceani]
MKTTLYKALLLFFLVPAVACAEGDFKGRHTKQKRIKKEFKVSANDLLKINNSYGNIDIVTWDQNRVEIEVLVRTNGNDEEKVERKLREIDVIFNQSNGQVSAKTIFEKESGGSFFSSLFGGSSNVSMEINYRIKAPVTNQVDLSNDYGSINLDKLKGDARISCDYGRILVGELHGSNNYLSFDYTRNSSIGYVKRAKINADYSEFTIDDAGTIDLSADYTDSRFVKVENLSFRNDYGSLKVEKLRNLKGSGDYLGIKLGFVYSSLDISMDYGSLAIDKVMPGLKELRINSDYTGIKIGYDRDASFNFDVKTEYGGVNGISNSNFTVNKRNQSGSENHYQGYYGTSNSGGNISISSSYGSVSFVD